MISTVAFDADDTLWQNERFYHLTKENVADLLRDYCKRDHLEDRLLAAERRNLSRYGFGIKGFMLSLIETAIEVSDRELPASIVADILAIGRDMLEHPVELLPGAGDTVDRLARTHKLVLVTKGDLFDQERKIAASGLADYFAGIEIVSDKNRDTYSAVFARYGETPDKCLMIGNSMKSDVIPAIEAGGWGVYAPHGLTWAMEHADAPADHPRFREIERIDALPKLLEGLANV
ncbi:MAG: HAD family hydrolase [Parvularculaceae bacterium]